MTAPHDNLKTKLLEKRIPQNSVARVLGIHVNTLANKMEGRSPFTIEEAFTIKDVFFPDADLRFLFCDHDQ